MLRRVILPLKHPLRPVPQIRLSPSLLLRPTRYESTVTAFPTPDMDSERKSSSFYISNVFPIKLAYWDFRPTWAAIREEAMMEQLHDIGSEITDHGFRIESWEIARKDGGVFMHFSYIPPPDPEVASSSPSEREGAPAAGSGSGSGTGEGDMGLSAITSLPEVVLSKPTSPGRLFLPQFIESAKKHGGIPNWLGQWWANWTGGQGGGVKVPGHTLYSRGVTRVGAGAGEADEGNTCSAAPSLGSSPAAEAKVVSMEAQGTLVKGSGSGMKGFQAIAGEGRVWVVKGRQWTEDMNRFPSNRLRVEFDGPDVSQEMLYTLFRPYGRVGDIAPPTPVPAGSLRYATVSFSRLAPAATAINTLHGYSTPTNTADFTLRASGTPSQSIIPLSRLRLYYERPLKAHAIRDWISGHPRIALPVIAFLIGTLSYTFFDPIRAFFVRSQLEGVWDIEKYTLIKWAREKFLPLTTFSFFRPSSTSTSSSDADGDAVGQNAWEDRITAEKSVERWLKEYPSTFIAITGPPGSGKTSLVSRVLKKEDKPSLVIDCSAMGKAKNDGALVSGLAEETGYWPVFSFLSSINGLIDLASVGLIGQKAGFATPVDQQLRQMLEIVGGALKDVSAHTREEHKSARDHQEDELRIRDELQHRQELISRGGWHDGRLDCIAGNGVMSELGMGVESIHEADMYPPAPPLIDDNAPINGEAVPPTSASIANLTLPLPKAVKPIAELDEESEYIKTLPIVVLKNFALKTAKGDLWNVLAEWGASLVENRIAHVIVITEGATATKALTRAQPTKPLNSVSLADADQANSLSYVNDKLGSGKSTGLTVDDSIQISKLGGRMVDLETLVYKVRTGSVVKDAVDDIILRNLVELRKAAFGDDAEDAKALPWTRAQAWKVVSELAQHGEVSYSQLLQDFPFKGAEQSLKALEEHELVSVTYVDGRASRLKPGKPVFRYAFEALVNGTGQVCWRLNITDPIFKAFHQIEYNNALIASSDAAIKTCETELSTLKEITANGGDEALGVSGSFLGIGKHSAIRDRAKWLLDKMGKNMDKLSKLENENVEMMKVLASGKP